MALPEAIKNEIEKQLATYCKQRVPLHARDKIRVSFGIRGNSVTLYEERPGYIDPTRWTKMPVAQLRYSTEDSCWTLYWADRNDKWQLYFDTEPTPDLQDLLDEITEDPMGTFWG